MYYPLRLFWYVFLGINAALIVGFWWRGSGVGIQAGGAEALISFGRLAGLLAAGTVLLQFVFMGRTPMLERAFGLDKLSRIHHQSGQWSFILLLAHPLLLTIGYSRLAQTSFWHQLVIFLFQYQYVGWAAVGLVLFLVVVGWSLTIVRRKLKYESWYFVHLLVYVAILASFWHQINVGSDFQVSQVFYWYWIMLYVVVLGAHGVFRFGWPLYLFWWHRFQVDHIERETPTTVSLYLTGRRLSEFTIQPGQFMIVRFLTGGLWWQAHPFSLSRPADGKYLRITVKELGDFTRQIKAIPVGTKVIIDGPFGVFTSAASRSSKVLFIAGGIGITPIRSLMEHLLRTGAPTVLLYGNQTAQDMPLRAELRLLEEQYSGTVIDVISNDSTFEGERGFIDAEKIKRLVPDVAERDVYLCGPVPMMKAVREALAYLGVPAQQIYWERFAL